MNNRKPDISTSQAIRTTEHTYQTPKTPFQSTDLALNLTDDYFSLGITVADTHYLLRELGPDHTTVLLNGMVKADVMNPDLPVRGQLERFVDCYREHVLGKVTKSPFEMEQEGHLSVSRGYIPSWATALVSRRTVMVPQEFVSSEEINGLWGVDLDGRCKGNPWKSETAIGGMTKQVEDNSSYRQTFD